MSPTYMEKLEDFYFYNDDRIYSMWREYIDGNDWGSGDDRIRVTDDMFWAFVAGVYEREKIIK